MLLCDVFVLINILEKDSLIDFGVNLCLCVVKRDFVSYVF